MDDPDATGDALRRLEERLTRASDAAERLIAEAADTVAGRIADPRPPASGWQVPDGEDDAGPGAGGGRPRGPRQDDLELLVQIVERMRDLVPAELQRRLAEALRELLLALRALIDSYLDRLERRRATPVEVKDIPIS